MNKEMNREQKMSEFYQYLETNDKAKEFVDELFSFKFKIINTQIINIHLKFIYKKLLTLLKIKIMDSKMNYKMPNDDEDTPDGPPTKFEE